MAGMQSSLFTPGSLHPSVMTGGSMRAPPAPYSDGVASWTPSAGTRRVGDFGREVPAVWSAVAPVAVASPALSPSTATATAAPRRSVELRPTRHVGATTAFGATASSSLTAPITPATMRAAHATSSSARPTITVAPQQAGLVASQPPAVNPVASLGSASQPAAMNPVASLGIAFAQACTPTSSLPSGRATQARQFGPGRSATKSLGTAGQVSQDAALPITMRKSNKRPTWTADQPTKGYNVHLPVAKTVVTDLEAVPADGVPLSPTAIIAREEASFQISRGLSASMPPAAGEEEGAPMLISRRKPRIPTHVRMEQERLKAFQEAEEMKASPNYDAALADVSPVAEENGNHLDDELDIVPALTEGAAARERRLREEFAAELSEHTQTMSLVTQSASMMAAGERIAMSSFPSEMIPHRQGPFSLRASDRSTCQGTYLFVTDDQRLYVGDDLVARFSATCVGDIPRQWRYRLGTGANRPLPSTHIRICESSIEEEIHNPENQGSVFVMNFQFNGVSYPSSGSIVETLEEYKQDVSGELRARLGQLAVHPAAGQFLLDNAANSRSPDGINALADVLKRLQESGFALELVNGYLQVPIVEDEADRLVILTLLRQEMSKCRTLLMQDVAACGLTPGGGSLRKEAHLVNLIYASAVPVQASLTADQEEFQAEIAKLLIFTQYYGALKSAAHPDRHFPGQKTKVFLMPLGSTVLSTSWQAIAEGMVQAVEALLSDELERLDIIALTWSGDPSAKETLAACLYEA